METILGSIPMWVTLLFVGATLLRLVLSVAGIVIYGSTAPIKNRSTRMISIWIISALLVFWVGQALILGRIGFFQVDQTTMPPPAVAIAAVLPILVGLALFYLWDTFRRIIFSIPLHWMIGIQFLRVTGGSFLILYSLGLLPGTFGLPSGIGDTVTGTLAIPVAYLYFKRKSWSHKVATAWNYLGLAELLMLVPLGILTSPTSFQLLALDNPNYLTTNWPVVLAPIFHVPIGILMHFYTIAMLRRAQFGSQPSGDKQRSHPPRWQEDFTNP